MDGWVKMWYNLREWRYKRNPKIMALWMHFLLFAEWQGKDRGVLVTSLRNIAEETGLTLQEVRTALQKLSASGECLVEVTQLPTQGATHGIAQRATKITICKYEQYQGKQKTDNTTSNTISNTESNTSTSINKEDNKDNAHARESEIIDRIYSLYPSSTIRGNGKCSTGKCAKDKKRIATLLKNHTEEQITKIIERYVKEQDGQYLKNFSTFLNNLPEYQDDDMPARRDPTPSEVLGPAYDEWMKTHGGQLFSEQFK